MAFVMNGPLLKQLTFGYPSGTAALSGLRKDFVANAEHASIDDALMKRLEQYALGRSDDFADVRLDEEGLSSFQRRVISECRAIPIGQTRSYSEIASTAGAPGAARAVGTVMSRNLFPLVVPCHRVVGSGGTLGGYSAFNGLETKQLLLRREGARIATISAKKAKSGVGDRLAANAASILQRGW